MNKPQGILLVLSGPSGAGKGTICGRLLEKRDHMAYSVSCTTREPRKGEVDGKNYFFKTREEFGLTLVMVTHDLAIADRADRIFRMDNGELKLERDYQTGGRTE